MTEPVHSEVRDSAEPIAEAIESLRSEHGHPDTEGDDGDEYEVENDPPATKELMEEIKSFLKDDS